MTQDAAVPQQHALYEDALAILLGTLFLACGIVFYGKAQLVAGGTAGMGLLFSYATGWGFWVTFSVVNLPFYALGLWRMGWRFTLRTVLAVSLVALFSALLPGWMRLDGVNPVFATLFGSALMGNGLLMLLRHRTALGGVNILAMFLHERFGWRIPVVQFSIDTVTLSLSALFIAPGNIALSLLGALVVNVIIAVNHRADRYVGMT
jgi:uncharacterized membrane-anchored protein YitT (DUF2179 family)